MAQAYYVPKKLIDILHERGYTDSEFSIDRLYRQYTSPNKKSVMTKAGFYHFPFISSFAKSLSKDKMRSYNFAESLGFKIPQTLQTSSLERATEFLYKNKRIISKPLHKSGGQGLTVDITKTNQLEGALQAAEFDGVAPLLQEQFIGEEIRLTVLRGVVVSVILRRSPRVIGDGTQTISQLIAGENDLRRKLSFPFLSYPQLSSENIAKEYMDSTAVLAADQVLELSKTTMIKHGASFYGVSDAVHPSYVKIATELASRLNPAMLIIDLMVKNYTDEASDDNYVFLEFNTSPSLIVYSSLRAGDQPDVPSMLADMLDEYSSIY